MPSFSLVGLIIKAKAAVKISGKFKKEQVEYK